jgi:competence protein ComEC
MDIGQGDAILLQDPSGLAVLIDGGREPRTLDRALRRHNVDRLAILVVTHGDADHAGGLVEMITTMDIGELWLGSYTAEAPLLEELSAAATERDIPIRRVARGDRFEVGKLDLSVLGPARKYLAENDGSVIILATAARSILLAGDAEAVAQRELPPIRPDIVVVPHHGSSTTDLGWLRAILRDEAILSYGPNTYGHPNEAVVALLNESGVGLKRTAEDGDVVVDLGRP